MSGSANEGLIVARLESDLAKARRKIDRLLDRLDAQTKEMHKQAEQYHSLQKGKDEFLAAISHELRTPMNGILGMAELLLTTNLDPDQRQWSMLIQESGNGLLKTISELLDVAAIKSGRFRLETAPFNLEERLEGLRCRMAIDAGAKRLVFQCSLNPGTPIELVGDGRRLMQILDNLVDNAIKFTPSGTITVRVGLQEEDALGLVLRFAVQDSGIGISHDDMGRIFDIFTQKDGSASKAANGMGLGLSIAAELTRLMGGDIHVQSIEGVGSVFFFTARLQRAGSSESQALDLRRAVVRVLVVDADESLRHALAALLRGWGLRAEEAVDSDDAFNKIMGACDLGDPFRMVVLERELERKPGGRTLFDAVEADRRSNGTRVVWMDAHSVNERKKNDSVDRGTEILAKPFSGEEFYHAVWHLLAQPSLGNGRETTLPTLRRKDARILVIENEMVSQMVLTAIFGKLGVAHDMVDDVSQASRALKNGSYDLLLVAANLDPVFPDFDGPTVVMTVDNCIASISTGISQIAKPIDVCQLVRVLNDHL